MRRNPCLNARCHGFRFDEWALSSERSGRRAAGCSVPGQSPRALFERLSRAGHATISSVDVIPLVLSGCSLAVAIVGTALSYRRSGEALRESRKASAAALWSGAQEAVQRMIGFDPTTEPVGDRLVNLRIAMIALVDEMDDWAGLDAWLEAERALGAVLGRQVMEQAKPNDSVEQRLQLLEPYHVWAQLLSSNLRRFRTVGYDADAAAKLRANAEARARQVYVAHRWELPPTTIPGLKALDD